MSSNTRDFVGQQLIRPAELEDAEPLSALINQRLLPGQPALGPGALRSLLAGCPPRHLAGLNVAVATAGRGLTAAVVYALPAATGGRPAILALQAQGSPDPLPELLRWTRDRFPANCPVEAFPAGRGWQVPGGVPVNSEQGTVRALLRAGFRVAGRTPYWYRRLEHTVVSSLRVGRVTWCADMPGWSVSYRTREDRYVGEAVISASEEDRGTILRWHLHGLQHSVGDFRLLGTGILNTLHRMGARHVVCLSPSTGEGVWRLDEWGFGSHDTMLHLISTPGHR